MDALKKRTLDAIGRVSAKNNPPQNYRPNNAKAIKTSEEVETMTDTGQIGSVASEDQKKSRRDQLKVLKLIHRRQLTVLECAGQQVTKELTWQTNHSVIHARVYASDLKSLGQDMGDTAVIRALRSKRSTLVQLAGKERRVLGPADVEMKVDFVQMKTWAWVTLNQDLDGQVYVGKNKLR